MDSECRLFPLPLPHPVQEQDYRQPIRQPNMTPQQFKLVFHPGMLEID
jgi:hypothetical protein